MARLPTLQFVNECAFRDDGDGTVHISTKFTSGAYIGKVNAKALVEWLNRWIEQPDEADEP